jgi:hypothetical protein
MWQNNRFTGGTEQSGKSERVKDDRKIAFYLFIAALPLGDDVDDIWLNRFFFFVAVVVTCSFFLKAIILFHCLILNSLNIHDHSNEWGALFLLLFFIFQLDCQKENVQEHNRGNKCCRRKTEKKYCGNKCLLIGKITLAGCNCCYV